MKMTHAELCDRAEKWLWNTVFCSVVLVEFTALCNEIPDAIGWKSGRSYLVECKASRDDFLSDKNKWHRQHPSKGMGSRRYYMCEPGVIKVADLPEGWGLLYVTGKQVRQVAGLPHASYDACPFQDRNMDSEMAMLLSALRRFKVRGLFDIVYEKLPEV